MSNPWDNYNAQTPDTAHPSHYGNGSGRETPERSRSRNRTRSVFEPPTEYLAFPEPQIYRSSSQRASPAPYHALHRNSRSDVGPLTPTRSNGNLPDFSPASPSRAASPASSYYANDEVRYGVFSDRRPANLSAQFERSESNLSHQMTNVKYVSDTPYICKPLISF